jgi:hypothetical protein
MRKILWVAGIVMGIGVDAAIGAQTQTQGQTPASARNAPAEVPMGSAPKVKVGAVVAAKAASPVPSAAAKNQGQQTSVGKGSVSVKASSPSSYWTDLVDIDDDGQIEENQFLMDAKRGVLYTYREDDFKCNDGTPTNGEVLMGIYVKGNKIGRPAGSGWYLVGLKPGQCGEQKGGTFGCKFDAAGKETSCGPAAVNDISGELDIVVRRRK